MTTLTTEGLSYGISGRHLVDDVTLTAADGETVGLVGPNGSGKTTLLRCVYGTLRPTHGRVLLDGADLHAMGAKARARRIATVPQDGGGAGFGLTVREVVAMGRSPHKRFWEQDTDTDADLVRAALARVGIADLADRAFPTLSGGERQRALMARALVQQPSVVVLDEPTNHLDIRFQLEILSLVRDLGTTNLVALHDLNLAAYSTATASTSWTAAGSSHPAPRRKSSPPTSCTPSTGYRPRSASIRRRAHRPSSISRRHP